MAHIYRLIRFLIVAIGLFNIASAYSAILPIDNYCRDGQAGNQCGSRDSRQSAYSQWLNSPGLRSACKSDTSYPGSPPPASVYIYNQGDTFISFNFSTPSCWGSGKYFNEAGGLIGTWTKVGSSCPAPSVPSGSSCVCPAPLVEEGGTCVEPKEQCVMPLVEGPDGKCACPAGKVEELDANGLRQCVPSADTQCKTFYATGNTIGGRFTKEYRLTGKIADGSKFCMPGQFENENRGCIVLFEQFAAFGSGQDWVTEGKFDGKPGDNGLACTVGTGDTPAVPQPEKCPKGYTGTVNGLEVCVDKVPDSGVEPGSKETTVDDGTNTTTTRTNSNTTCENGRCTTTTTVTTTVTNNASGTSTNTTNSTTTTQSQTDFCKANANAKLCGGSGLPNIDGGGSGGGGNGEEDPSSFTGACAGGFQCKGDAIQCAIAREQHIRACRLFDKESPESRLYEQFKGKEGNQTTDNPNNEAISLAGKIDTSDAIGGGGCIGDLSVTVWGQSLSLPLSNLCQYLAMLGNVLVAVSMLMATRIVTRG